MELSVCPAELMMRAAERSVGGERGEQTKFCIVFTINGGKTKFFTVFTIHGGKNMRFPHVATLGAFKGVDRCCRTS